MLHYLIRSPDTLQPANGVVFTLNFSSLDTLAFICYFLVVGLVAVIASRRERVAVVFLGGLFWKRGTASAAALVMAATLPVTIGVKLLMPNVAFLDQMWLAGLTLIAVFVGVSLTQARSIEPCAAEVHSVATTDKPQRDILFDVLCLGVVAATGILYWVFF